MPYARFNAPYSVVARAPFVIGYCFPCGVGGYFSGKLIKKLFENKLKPFLINKFKKPSEQPDDTPPPDTDDQAGSEVQTPED
ncbi:MAG: hypothetical protein K2G38_06735 [Clostridia bacterium]|nr:hypothetical protein [Clostridia bacterium]